MKLEAFEMVDLNNDGAVRRALAAAGMRAWEGKEGIIVAQGGLGLGQAGLVDLAEAVWWRRMEERAQVVLPGQADALGEFRRRAKERGVPAVLPKVTMEHGFVEAVGRGGAKTFDPFTMRKEARGMD
jgi:hypothetical protein